MTRAAHRWAADAPRRPPRHVLLPAVRRLGLRHRPDHRRQRRPRPALTPTFATSGKPGPASRPPLLQSVTIALDILDALAEAPSWGSVSLLGAPASQEHGPPRLLGAGRPGSVGPGARPALPARAALRRAGRSGPGCARSWARQGLPLLVELRNALGETVQLGVPAGRASPWNAPKACTRRYSTNARRSPIHCSSAGKVLAALDLSMVEARLRAGLPPSTGYTIVGRRCSWPRSTRCAERAGAVSTRPSSVLSSTVPVEARPGGPVVAPSRWSARPHCVIGDHRGLAACTPERGSPSRAGARRLPAAPAMTPTTSPQDRPRRAGRAPSSNAGRRSNGSTRMAAMPTRRAPSTHSGIVEEHDPLWGDGQAPGSVQASGSGLMHTDLGGADERLEPANSGRPSKN